MKLHYKEQGLGEALIILHGLFGSLDNWQTLANRFAQNYRVVIADQRNHGRSPHSKQWSYELMSDDLLELMDDLGLEKAHVLGHSMGGKTAMHFALKHSERLHSVVIVDIAPKAYAPHHDAVIKALYAVDPASIGSRRQAEDIMQQMIPDAATCQFLLKNLYRNEEGRYAWRFNLDVISSNIEMVNSDTFIAETSTQLPALFVRGERSGYVSDEDMIQARSLFRAAELATIPAAGHWVHADQPGLFTEVLLKFLATVC